jgi:hypothetical protein
MWVRSAKVQKKKGQVYFESYYFISGKRLIALEGQVSYGEGNPDCRSSAFKELSKFFIHQLMHK